MIGVAVLLIALGLGAYSGTGGVSVTALIPAFFGIAFAGLGALGQKDRFRVPAAYGAPASGVNVHRNAAGNPASALGG